MTKPEMLLWLDDARGVYIPRDFATSFEDRTKSVSGVDPEVWAVLEAGPDHPEYWDAWVGVTDKAIVTDENGVKYSLWQDSDLWLVPIDMEWSEAEDKFVWPNND